jgi:hypothetical protein
MYPAESLTAIIPLPLPVTATEILKLVFIGSDGGAVTEQLYPPAVIFIFASQ